MSTIDGCTGDDMCRSILPICGGVIPFMIHYCDMLVTTLQTLCTHFSHVLCDRSTPHMFATMHATAIVHSSTVPECWNYATFTHILYVSFEKRRQITVNGRV